MYADQPKASLPGCRILKPQYTTLSRLLPIFPGDQLTANPVGSLCCLLSPCPKARVIFLPDMKCSDISFLTSKDCSSSQLGGQNLPLPCGLCCLLGTSACTAWEERRLGMYFTGNWKKKAKLSIQNNHCLRVFYLLTDHLQGAFWRCAAENWDAQTYGCCWCFQPCC